MSDEKLRAIYNARVAQDAPADRAQCPTPEQLQSLAASNKGGAPNLKLLDHVFGCAHCRPEFALLRAVQTAEESSIGSSPAMSVANRRWFSAPRIAAAAILLIAIGIGGTSFFKVFEDGRGDIMRNGPIDPSGVVLVGPTANETLQSHSQFVWRKVAGATTYEVQLLDTNGVVLKTQITSDTVLTLNAEDRARVDAVRAIDWFVSARQGEGNERRSGVVRVRVGDATNK